MASASVSGQPDVSLEFIADLNISTGAEFFDLPDQPVSRDPASSQQTSSLQDRLRRKSSGEFGGISGIAYDSESKLLYALSDSSKPTIFVLSLEIAERAIRIAPKDVLRLSDAAGAPIPLWTLDPEGIALSEKGNFLISSEGYAQRTPFVDPGIFRFGLSGRSLGSLTIPESYLPKRDGEQTMGVRPNQGFESLSLSPSGKELYVATEGPLVQDDEQCGEAVGCSVRLLHYRMSADSDQLVAEYAYQKDPPEAPSDFGNVRPILGLTEILAIGERKLLTLERGFARAEDGRRRQIIRVYEVEIPADSQHSERPLDKRLVLDLDSIVGQLSPGYRRLDNFEGMCLGPNLDNGNRTILMVSDNNYSERQRTSFLAFQLMEH